jgi:hypothetical protein
VNSINVAPPALLAPDPDDVVVTDPLDEACAILAELTSAPMFSNGKVGAAIVMVDPTSASTGTMDGKCIIVLDR